MNADDMKISPVEKRDLEREAGRQFIDDEQALMYRIRRDRERAVELMLNGKRGHVAH